MGVLLIAASIVVSFGYRLTARLAALLFILLLPVWQAIGVDRAGGIRLRSDVVSPRVLAMLSESWRHVA
jgi:hypothetical protein